MKSFQSPIGCTRFSLVVNIFLFILKMMAGIFGRSQALIADALNSLLDIVANIVVWFGINISKRPPDSDHPYGHGNADNLAAIFVALVLFITGAYIGRESIHAIVNREFQTPTFLATAAAAVTILIKESLYWYTLKIGRKFKSAAVIANAYDHRSDVIVSVGVLIGIVVAQTRFPILDPIAGLWVAFFILKQGIKIIRENIQTLMVVSPGTRFESDVRGFISGMDGVVDVVWLKSRIVGARYFIDTAIQVNSDVSVYEGHEIATRVRHAVSSKYPDVFDILVHVEPDR
ncbi:MAG: cation transporter [Candidatus Zixiibacteriota bacterium]|nr:MAG: cation transporter [candidate division Zixibacteria bacterium]